MKNLKQEIINVISKLPESITIDDVMYRLYVIDKVKKAQEAAEKGEVTSTEELRKEMQSW